MLTIHVITQVVAVHAEKYTHTRTVWEAMVSRGYSSHSLFSDAASRSAHGSLTSFDFSKRSSNDLDDDWDEFDDEDDDDEEGKTIREKLVNKMFDYGPQYKDRKSVE